MTLPGSAGARRLAPSRAHPVSGGRAARPGAPRGGPRSRRPRSVPQAAAPEASANRTYSPAGWSPTATAAGSIGSSTGGAPQPSRRKTAMRVRKRVLDTGILLGRTGAGYRLGVPIEETAVPVAGDDLVRSELGQQERGKGRRQPSPGSGREGPSSRVGRREGTNRLTAKAPPWNVPRASRKRTRFSHALRETPSCRSWSSVSA